MAKFDMFVPDSTKDLLKFLHDNKREITLIANGSDLVNRIRRREVHPKFMVDLSGLQDLSYVRLQNGKISIGALTTLAHLIASEPIRTRYPVFQQVAEKFGGPQILNVATIGGNVCAASSSEDLLPVLLVLDAKVKTKSLSGERTLPLAKFVTGKRAVDLRSDEILAEVFFDDLPKDAACSFEKVGMRNSLIIAFVNVALFIQLNQASSRLTEIRISFNRVKGRTPERAYQTEDALRNKEPSEANITKALEGLGKELHTKSDYRVSGEYRLKVAKALFRRALENCLNNLKAT